MSTILKIAISNINSIWWMRTKMMNIVVFTQKLRWYQIRVTGNNRENKKGTLKRDFFKLAPIKCCLNKNGIFLLFIHNEWDLWLKYYFIHCKTKQSWICMYIYSQMVKQKPWHCTSPSILKAVENNRAKFCLQGVRLDKVVCYEEHSYNLPDL